MITNIITTAIGNGNCGYNSENIAAKNANIGSIAVFF
jgi:hypothetical protein